MNPEHLSFAQPPFVGITLVVTQKNGEKVARLVAKSDFRLFVPVW